MRCLLDTHVFLWWISDDERLSETARKILASGENELFFSAAGCWEIAIKARLGKLDMPKKLEIFIADQLSDNAIQTMPVLAAHALHIYNLPDFHRDPFDRMIIAQSQLEGIPIVTSDPLVSRYDVQTLWG